MKAAITVCAVFALVAGVSVRASPQNGDLPPDAKIEMRRTSCFGTCPIYSVTIDARGLVVYEGENFVRVVERRTARIPVRRVAALLASAERIRFFDLRDRYHVVEHPDGTVTAVTDLPTTIVTIAVNGRSKRVEDYFGTPDALREFEREIDEAAGTTRWIFLDEAELEELVRSGWSATGDEGARFLRQAIERDDLVIARSLIALGADLYGPRDHRLPPLLSVRSGAMVDLLVNAGADPNMRPAGTVAGFTPLIAAYYKPADVAEALLKAGARLEDTEHGRTALWYAACRGNWSMVTLLLRAGANPRGSADMSALECTRQARGDASGRRRLFREDPRVEDFERVIALLENAGKQNGR